MQPKIGLGMYILGVAKGESKTVSGLTLNLVKNFDWPHGTKTRVNSLMRLLKSLKHAYYLGDDVPISFDMDSRVDNSTLKLVKNFDWHHGINTLT